MKNLKDELKNFIQHIEQISEKHIPAKYDVLESYKTLVEYDLEDDIPIFNEVYRRAFDCINWAIEAYVNNVAENELTGLYELEIIPGTGGDDTEDLSNMLFTLYSRHLQKKDKSCSVDTTRRQIVFTNCSAYKNLKATEECMYKVIRISPFCDKKQTSFLQVSVRAIRKTPLLFIKECDVEYEVTKSSGSGGQHVNKTESAVRARHKKTGITAFISEHRSQHQNKKLAFEILNKKVAELEIKNNEDKKRAEYKKNSKIAWGNSYTRVFNFHKETYLKNRINGETYNIKKIIDVDLDKVMNDQILYYLKNEC